MSTSGLDRLPFVATRPGGSIASWWAPEPTCVDYGRECEIGRGYAAALQAYLEQNGEAGGPELGHIVRSMPRGEDFTGIEIGFWSGLSRAVCGEVLA